MKEDEINKTIAEYMGFENVLIDDDGTAYIAVDDIIIAIREFNYTKSLDALIPVVEKLECREFGYSYSCETAWLICGNKELKSRFNGQESNISPALALATACVKVIQ